MSNEVYDDENKYEGIPLVTEDAREHLNPRQEIAYREHRRDLAEWMLNLGKDPEKAEGYSKSSVETRMNRLDLLYRFVWEREGRYVQNITTDHADQWMHHLARKDFKESTKAQYQESVKVLFKWKRYERGEDVEWDPVIEYSDPSTNYQPREYLTREDRRRLREAVMGYESVPHYNSLSPEERERWRKHLAQRLQKPAEEVTKRDFMQANSFKYPSMLYVALDAGLRPCEVGRANVGWFDGDNGVLRIPREESSKNRENWVVALKPETASIVRKWIQEREQREKYDGRRALWLTKYGNRYDKDSFRGVFRRVASAAGLDVEGRELTPYSIRHSTGTYVSDEEGLAVAAQQLRHKSKQTTQKYEHSSVDRQKEAVNRVD